jgi:hypothetical protein
VTAKARDAEKVKKVEYFPKLGVFLRFFPAQLKQIGKSTPYIGYRRRVIIMRQKHDLAEKVWYGVETAINVGEPLFRLSRAR